LSVYSLRLTVSTIPTETKKKKTMMIIHGKMVIHYLLSTIRLYVWQNLLRK